MVKFLSCKYSVLYKKKFVLRPENREPDRALQL